VTGMATATSPGLPVQHRQIGAELRRYRKLAGLTAIRAAAELGCGHSKISKIENAKLGINDTELALLLTLYNVPSDKADQLRAINGQPRPAEWWKAYRDAVPDWFQRYLSLESIATEIRKYEIEVIPGAFQT
jgi:transcriptional regulator with XRE-family HTH domain